MSYRNLEYQSIVASIEEQIKKPHKLRQKVKTSKTLDVGPKKIIKRAIDQAFQVFGATRYSGSTLSL